MKLNIEVDTTCKDGGVSVSISNVRLENYRKIRQADIDEAVCKVMEVALLDERRNKSEAHALAHVICYGTLPPQSACQEDTTSHSDSESSDI